MHLRVTARSNQTSTSATNEVAIIAKASPASKVGAPHWKGYGTLILHKTPLYKQRGSVSTKNTLHFDLLFLY